MKLDYIVPRKLKSARRKHTSNDAAGVDDGDASNFQDVVDDVARCTTAVEVDCTLEQFELLSRMIRIMFPDKSSPSSSEVRFEPPFPATQSPSIDSEGFLIIFSSFISLLKAFDIMEDSDIRAMMYKQLCVRKRVEPVIPKEEPTTATTSQIPPPPPTSSQIPPPTSSQFPPPPPSSQAPPPADIVGRKASKKKTVTVPGPIALRIAGVYGSLDASDPCHVFVASSYVANKTVVYSDDNTAKPHRKEQVHSLTRATRLKDPMGGQYQRNLRAKFVDKQDLSKLSDRDSREFQREAYYVSWMSTTKRSSVYSSRMASKFGQINGTLRVNCPYLHIVGKSICSEFNKLCTVQYLNSVIANLRD